MTVPPREDGAEWRNFYGRRHGKKLRAGQAALVEHRLAELAPPGLRPGENQGRAPLDLGALYPGRAVWLEIGFGGGEHMLAQAAATTRQPADPGRPRPRHPARPCISPPTSATTPATPSK